MKKPLIFALSGLCIVFLFLFHFHFVPSAFADSGPGSSTGEGDPKCSCIQANDPTNNRITCLEGNITHPKGYCATGVLCTMGKDGSGNPIPICKGTAAGTHPITPNDCWCTHSLTDQTGKRDQDLGGVNGRTCTDGVNVYQDYNQLGCAIDQECVEQDPIKNPVADPKGAGHGIAQCKALPCNCDNLNVPGAGKNGMTCATPNGNGTKDIFTCTELQVCTQAAPHNGQAICQQINNCTCDHPDTPGSQQNGYSCQMQDQNHTLYRAFCSKPSEACIQNADTTVSCKDETSKVNNPTAMPTLPPPPPPPCFGGLRYDKCDKFDTGLSALGIGPLSTDPSGFITQLVSVILGMSGGIAVLLIIIAGYRIMTSQGKPEALNQAREQLMAAIVGLLFLIFSFIILQVIITDILRIK